MLQLSLGVGVGVRERDLRGQNDARGEGKTSDELGRGTIKGDGGGRMVREGASTTSANDRSTPTDGTSCDTRAQGTKACSFSKHKKARLVAQVEAPESLVLFTSPDDSFEPTHASLAGLQP
jgi:hypothetical protein